MKRVFISVALVFGFFAVPTAVAQADQGCTGYNGTIFSFTNCGGQQCTAINIGPFWSNQCTDPYPQAVESGPRP